MSLSDWIVIIIIAVTVLYWYGTKSYNRFVDICAPHMKPVPFFGNIFTLMLQRISATDYILEIYDKFKGYSYGGLFQFDQPVFLLRDPELIKAVTVKDFEHFLEHPPFLTDDVEPLFAKALFNLKGQRWRDMRSTLSPAFTSSKMKAMFSLMDECGVQVTQFLEKCIKEQEVSSNSCKIEKEGNILVAEMKDLYTRYANDVIATAAFGISVDSFQNASNEFYEMGKDITNMAGIRAFKMCLFLMLPKTMKVFQMFGLKYLPDSVTNFFRQLVHGTMAVRERDGIVRPDMIHLLMQARKGVLEEDTTLAANGKKPKINWDDDDITAQAVSFFFAGFDTSSTLLCFVSHLLAVHPEIQAKLQNEIDEVLEKNGGKINYENLHAMKYLDMVVSEALRLYPPGVVTDRICTKTYTLRSVPPVQVNPGEALWIPTFAIHRDPEYFPNPEKFDPERFSDENKHKIKPFTYMPFGNGPRNCIGSRFALMESKLVIVHMLSHFNFKIVSKTPMPIKICRKGFTLTIEGGFWLGLELRNR